MSSFTIGEVCVSLVKDRVFEETSSREFVVCAYAKIQCAPTPVCEGALLSVFVCVCVRPRCQTAAIFASQTGREAAEARQTFEVLFSSRSSIHPEEICHVVLPF